MNSNETRHPDEKLLIPEASLKGHWRNASTSFDGTEFTTEKTQKNKKKLRRTLSAKNKKKDFPWNFKRCKSSPLNDQELLEEFKPREVHKSRKSLFQPRKLLFPSENSTSKTMEMKKAKMVLEKSTKKGTSNSHKTQTVRQHKARPFRKHSGVKWSAPASVGKLSHTELTSGSIAKEGQRDVQDFQDKMKEKKKETSKDSCPDSIEDENVKPEISPKVELTKAWESENGAVETVIEKSLTMTNSSKGSRTKEVSKTNGNFNKHNVQKLELLEEEWRETKIQIEATLAKRNENSEVIGSDMNPASSQMLEIEKPQAVNPHIKPNKNESSGLETPDVVNPDIKFGLCKTFEIEKPEGPRDIQLDGKNSHASEEESMLKDQFGPGKGKDTIHDIPASITISDTVKLLPAKHELKHEDRSESCLISQTTRNKVDESKDRILEDRLQHAHESTSVDAVDIYTQQVELQQQVQRNFTESAGKDAPVFNISKETSDEPNCSNEQHEVELGSTISALTPQNIYLKIDEPTHEMNPNGEKENSIAISESPLEVNQISTNSHSPDGNSTIAVINQICRRLEKSTKTPANKSEIVEINEIYDTLRGIEVKWGGDVRYVPYTFDRKGAKNKPLIRRDAGREKDDITEQTEGENWCSSQDAFEEADEGVKKNDRMLMSDGRKEGDINTAKQNESAVKSAAQEAADDVRPEDHHVTKGGGTPRTPKKPAPKPFIRRSDLGSWSCTVCTYLNSTGDFCEMCTAGRCQWQNEFTSPDCFRVKKSISSSMKRMWWRKRGKRNRY